jgi:hypothetical protein
MTTNADAAEKEAAAQARAANELRRRCVACRAARRRETGRKTATHGRTPHASGAPPPWRVRPVQRREMQTLHLRVARFGDAPRVAAACRLDSGRENEAPAGAAAPAGKTGEASRVQLSNLQVQNLYSNWCAATRTRVQQAREALRARLRSAAERLCTFQRRGGAALRFRNGAAAPKGSARRVTDS